MNISEYHTVELNPRGSYVTRGCHGTWAMKYDHSFLEHKRFGPGLIILSISISLRRNSICSCYGSKSILFVNRGNMHSMQCNEWKKNAISSVSLRVYIVVIISQHAIPYWFRKWKWYLQRHLVVGHEDQKYFCAWLDVRSNWRQM